ncbi:MAG: lipase maturation factor family protein [Gammaproteobacteria bacterium]
MGSHYELTGWLFLRGLGLIYFAAFASMSTQIEGLIGSNGILPVENALNAIAGEYPRDKYLVFPTLFWFDASDSMLTGVCYAGMTAAALIVLNILSNSALVLCYVLYLAIAVAGQTFTAFQWDALLLEIGFLALFLKSGSPLIVYLFRFLIARFMLMGGIVKLASGDPTWASLTALYYHYHTQPLPSPLAYYAHALPDWLQQLSVLGVFIIELVLPFFVFMSRRFRHLAAWSFIILQTFIMLTGNYNFFNLLTILLCLFLFDDQAIRQFIPFQSLPAHADKSLRPGPVTHGLAAFWLIVVILTCSSHIWLYHSQKPLPAFFNALVKTTSSFWMINNYGPFSVMTTERPEIIIEGSDDGRSWQPYLFNFKPVELDRELSWNIPHQPRLDWQMWFAALSTPDQNPWFSRFMTQLSEASPQVLSLLANNPFPKKPPVQLRALLYRYSFTTPEQRADTGHIWRRELLGIYWPIYAVDSASSTR